MYRVQFVQSRIESSQIKSRGKKVKKRTNKKKVHHHPIKLMTSSAVLKPKDQGKQEARQTTKVASLLPSVPSQRLHNGVITLIYHLNNKSPKNTSSGKAEKADLTAILRVSDHDENTTKIFDFP